MGRMLFQGLHGLEVHATERGLLRGLSGEEQIDGFSARHASHISSSISISSGHDRQPQAVPAITAKQKNRKKLRHFVALDSQ